MENRFYDNRPDSKEELRARTFDLPYARPPEPSRRMKKDIAEYVRFESAELTSRGLRYVRSAEIDGVTYYVWQTIADEFAYIEVYEDSVLHSLQNMDALTVEQFLITEYLRNQWQIDLA